MTNPTETTGMTRREFLAAAVAGLPLGVVLSRSANFVQEWATRLGIIEASAVPEDIQTQYISLLQKDQKGISADRIKFCRVGATAGKNTDFAVISAPTRDDAFETRAKVSVVMFADNKSFYVLNPIKYQTGYRGLALPMGPQEDHVVLSYHEGGLDKIRDDISRDAKSKRYDVRTKTDFIFTNPLRHIDIDGTSQHWFVNVNPRDDGSKNSILELGKIMESDIVSLKEAAAA